MGDRPGDRCPERSSEGIVHGRFGGDGGAMWKMWLREHGGWLAAGVVLMAAGFALARFWWFEFGMALVLLGAAALGCPGCITPRGRIPSCKPVWATSC